MGNPHEIPVRELAERIIRPDRIGLRDCLSGRCRRTIPPSVAPISAWRGKLLKWEPTGEAGGRACSGTIGVFRTQLLAERGDDPGAGAIGPSGLSRRKSGERIP